MSTEVEYHDLSTYLRDVIPTMNLINEISANMSINAAKPNIKCKLFDNNESYVKVAKAPVLTSRTKHIALEYHHFRSYVDQGLISIESIRTGEQNADILTKPVGEPQFHIFEKEAKWTLVL